jgi:hypothetical protein
MSWKYENSWYQAKRALRKRKVVPVKPPITEIASIRLKLYLSFTFI